MRAGSHVVGTGPGVLSFHSSLYPQFSVNLVEMGTILTKKV